jgi:hypothetical protein
MLFLSLLNFGAIEVILMLRVWILWEKSRAIGTLLIVMFVIGLTLGLGLVHVDIHVENFFPRPLLYLTPFLFSTLSHWHNSVSCITSVPPPQLILTGPQPGISSLVAHSSTTRERQHTRGHTPTSWGPSWRYPPLLRLAQLLTLGKSISFTLLISKVWMVTARSNPIVSALVRQYVVGACLLGRALTVPP